MVKVKKRLLALDGLRGFAALAVAISHLEFNLRSITDSPILNYLYRMISAGSTSVQLFFVLSGFLMAYLYPTVKNPFKFLKKRYLRIMPIFAVVVVTLWLVSTYGRQMSAFSAVIFLIVIALATNLFWRLMLIIKARFPLIGHVFFISFVLFQIVFLLFIIAFNFSPLSHFTDQLNFYQENLFIMLANLSMTLYWQREIVVMAGIIWSLVLEVFFYLIYPFYITPLIKISQKFNLLGNTLFVIIIIFIIYHLDLASRSMFSLQGLFILRASGFVFGICLANIYRENSKLWLRLKKFLQKPLVSKTTLILFFIAMAWEWPDRYHQIRFYVMLHYLFLSIIFTWVLASAIAEKTAAARFFKNKLLIFLGMISYSLYLIHCFVFERVSNSFIFQIFDDIFSQPVNRMVRALIVLPIAIFVAFILYRLVEAMYFKNKKLSINSQSVSKKNTWPSLAVISFSPKIKARIKIVVLIFFLLAFFNTDTAPSILINRHDIKAQPFKELVVNQNQSVTLPLIAKYPYLSAVSLAIDYAHDPAVKNDKQPQLIFELKDDQHQLIFRSNRHPNQLEGETQYPFGFPIQIESANKNYLITLSLEDAVSDEVYIDTSAGMISQANTQHLPNDLEKVVLILKERLLFSLTNKFLIFLFVFITFVALFQLKYFSTIFSTKE